MFNLPEFHELQRQRCKDLLETAERERLAQEAIKAQQGSGRVTGLAQDLLSRLSHIVSSK